MNNFDVINKHLETCRELIKRVEQQEKSNLNVFDKSVIWENLEVSLNTSKDKETLERTCSAINNLYLVGQKKLIREIVSEIQPDRTAILIKKMIDTPPIGSNFDKMVDNRKTWIDELSWHLTTRRNEEDESNRDTNSQDYVDILKSLEHYRHYFDSSLKFKGVIDLSSDIINNNA